MIIFWHVERSILVRVVVDLFGTYWRDVVDTVVVVVDTDEIAWM